MNISFRKSVKYSFEYERNLCNCYFQASRGNPVNTIAHGRCLSLAEVRAGSELTSLNLNWKFYMVKNILLIFKIKLDPFI